MQSLRSLVTSAPLILWEAKSISSIYNSVQNFFNGIASEYS
jgi:hypothetical protein